MSKITDAQIRKVIELTSTVMDDGITVWGYDTDIGDIRELIKEAREILEDA